MAEPPPPPPDAPDPADDETIVRDAWSPEEATVVHEQTTYTAPAPEPPPRRPLIWPGLLALLVLVLGGLAAFLLFSGDDEDGGATTAGARTVAVPEVVGSPEADARASLRAAGFEVTVASVPSDDAQPGTVVAQDPAGGTEAEEGSTVRVNVAERPEQTTPAATTAPPATTTEPPPATTTEPPPTTTEPATTTTAPPPQPRPATVPDAVGGTLADAAASFGAEGLKVSVRYVPSTEPLGTVVAQAQDPGTELEAGDTVQVNVSPGAEPPPEAIVPGVVGRAQQDARGALEQAGFEVLAVELDAGRPGIVGSQSPPAGARVPGGTLVILYVGR